MIPTEQVAAIRYSPRPQLTSLEYVSKHELAPLLNASAAEEKTSVLDAAYWRRFLGELKALV